MVEKPCDQSHGRQQSVHRRRVDKAQRQAFRVRVIVAEAIIDAE